MGNNNSTKLRGQQNGNNNNNGSNQKQLTQYSQELDNMLRNSNGNKLVVFMASWCGYCKQFKPEVEAAAQSSPGITYIETDVQSSPFVDYLVKENNIGGFPQAVMFYKRSNNQYFSEKVELPARTTQALKDTFNRLKK